MEEKKIREGRGGNVWRSKIFGRQRRRKTEKGKEEIIWIRKISGYLRRRRTEKENEENTWSSEEKKNREGKVLFGEGKVMMDVQTLVDSNFSAEGVE